MSGPDAPAPLPHAGGGRLLDLSRIVSRLGRGPMTGIDRVELTYLRTLLAGDRPLHALVRTAPGYCLLDRDGTAQLAALAAGDQPLPEHPDILSRLTRRGDPLRARAETAVRRLSSARATAGGLGRLLARLPGPLAYVNTGHANLSGRMFAALHARADGRAVVMIHDVIPLDHPEYTRPGQDARFARMIAHVSAGADLVIYNSAATRARAEPRLAAFGRIPPGIVAHLGTTLVAPDAGRLPADLDLARPYFVVLGTIEPRKNHALLLDVWEQLARSRPADDLPSLVIAGARGWNNAALFARLDDPRMRDGAIVEVAGLDDAACAALVAGAVALLFPSHAEGFGLPATEAAARGTPVICSDLPVFREILGDYPVYLNNMDVYSWTQTILAMTGAARTRAGTTGAEPGHPAIPTWDAHFKTVLNLF